MSQTATQVQIEHLEKGLDEVKEIALSARKRAEGCNQEDRLKEMAERISRWDRWWKATMVSVVAGILAVVGFVWSVQSRANEVDKRVEDVQRSVAEVTSKVTTIAEQQRGLRDGVNKQNQLDSEHRDMLRDVLQEALDEMKQAKKKTRGR